MGGWVDRWEDGWVNMNGWMGGWMDRPRSAECVPHVSRRGFGRDGYEERPLTEFKGTLLYIACWPLVSRSPLTDTDAMSFTA